MSKFERDVLISTLAEQNLDINNSDNLIMVCKKIDGTFNQKKKDLHKIFK